MANTVGKVASVDIFVGMGTSVVSILDSWFSMFKLLELAGRLVVVVALVSWWFEREDRLENKHNQAWTLIMSARGAVTGGGR